MYNYLTMQTINYTPPTIAQIFIRYGLPLGLFFIVMTILLYLLDMDTEKWAGYLSWGIMLVAAFYMIYDVRKSQNGLITFGEGFKVVFFALLFANIISSIYFFIHIQFVNTNFMEALEQAQRAEMLSRGMSEEMIEKSMALAESFNSPTVSVPIGLLVNTVISAIFGAIAAAIMKKE